MIWDKNCTMLRLLIVQTKLNRLSVMKNILLALLFVMTLVNITHGQQLKKPNLYLYFDASDTSLYFKNHRQTTYRKHNKEIPYQYTVYTFILKKENRRYVEFVNDHLENFKIVDSIFVKKYSVEMSKIKNVLNLSFDTYSPKKFLYRKAFIIEPISPNKYKLFEVRTMLNSNW